MPNAVQIIAVEDDEDEDQQIAVEHDYIPGPPPSANANGAPVSPRGSSKKGLFSRVLNMSIGSGGAISNNSNSNSRGSNKQVNNNAAQQDQQDHLQISNTEHNKNIKWSGAGILASREDLALSPAVFAAGCNLLQAAARGDNKYLQELIKSGKTHVNFRDYDRRTALHVAASEGHLHTVKYLAEQAGAKVNRSDRWGGSPLDDAHRHQHQDVITYLRQHAGATTGSGNRLTNLIKAAAEGDLEEVQTLLQFLKSTDVNRGDYDKRTALHLAAGEGHVDIVRALCHAGADVNVEDRWSRRPLDDAMDGHYKDVVELLQSHGAAQGGVHRRLSQLQQEQSQQGNNTSVPDQSLDMSGKKIVDNMRVEFNELEMIDRIGNGAFGEIYKCRWRGTLVAAKIIKSAKIRREWTNKRVTEALQNKKNKGNNKLDVDDAIAELDQAEMDEDEKDLALADFRQEISVLKSLRHPHIVLLLAYSTTENYECLISELMKCSLLDVFKSHLVQQTKMPKKTQIIYATQLALGMNYLHTCRPPIIHRDLKPANLLIDHSGVLKISDFGLSKVRPDPGKDETEAFQMTGETGSYRFMAPEVFRHEDYNERVDVYSYAMIFFYLLIGRPPWAHLPGLEAVRKASDEGDRPTIPRDLDIRLQNLLKECWDDNSKTRPSFEEILSVMSAYSSDAFHQNKNEIITHDKVGGCHCVIQ